MDNDGVVSARVLLKLKQRDCELTDLKLNLLNDHIGITVLNLGLDCMMFDGLQP